MAETTDYEIKLTTTDQNNNTETDLVTLNVGDFGYHRNITLDKLGLYDEKLKEYVTEDLINYAQTSDIDNLF